MVKYPLKFSVAAETASGIATTWIASIPGSAEVTLAIPPEFEGPGGGYSPEDFYALALLNCFAATFKVVAERSRLVYGRLILTGELIVDRDERGSPWMSRFFLRAHLRNCEDIERGERILKKVSELCLILNSVRTEKVFELSAEAG